jgi:hypothetical protein
MNDLSKIKKNYFSQYGEDGILEEIFKRLERKIKLENYVCEFGAWDGIFLSNVCHLIKNKGFKGLLIEADKDRFLTLNKNYPNKEIIKVNRLVNFEGKNSLDSILKEYNAPVNFDLLSIDIDGNDIHIIDSLANFFPKVICVEFNPAIPNQVEYVQPIDMNLKHGSSAKAICNYASKKGYELIAVTDSNLILIQKKLHKYLSNRKYTLDELYPKGKDAIIIFPAFDGTILSNKENIILGWHQVPVSIHKHLQFLPKFFRKFPGDWGFLKKIFFLFFLLIRIPGEIMKNKKKSSLILVKYLKDIFKRN